MQNFSLPVRTPLIILALAILASPLSACGIKPKEVAPPPSENAQAFPHTYPAPSADAPNDVTEPTQHPLGKDKNHGSKL